MQQVHEIEKDPGWSMAICIMQYGKIMHAELCGEKDDRGREPWMLLEAVVNEGMTIQCRSHGI